MIKLIDVSAHNGVIDWAKVKNYGVQGAIIRTGFGEEHPSQIDTRFIANYKGCKAVGLPVGAYHYSYATTATDAAKEADFVLKLLKDKQFEYPIYFDIEDKVHTKLDKATCDSIVTAFCSRLEKAGYWAGVYSFDSFFATHLSTAIVQRFTAWVARVEDIKPTYCKQYGMHQYSWRGFVNGINGEVDLNYCFKDFPSMIKAKRLNGFTDTYKLTAVKGDLTMAEAVVRKARLEADGYEVKII
jgi:GH25 family lysozyme M1 (1,4-beta-N-acetylmuramidase)